MSGPSFPRLRFGFLLAPSFTLSAFANFIDVLRLAADERDGSKPIRCQWSVLSATMSPVRSSCGVAVQPDERLGDPASFDYIVVAGGLLHEQVQFDAASVAYLKRAAAAGVPLVGLCTGAFVLHRAGLMDGYQCCVSWFHHDDFLEQFEGLTPVSDQIFVVDRDRLTCSGGASSAHLAAFLVERHMGRSLAQKSLHIMIISESQGADAPQPGLPMELTTHDPLVRKALIHMQQRIDSPRTVDDIAAELRVSRRKLERHFSAAVGVTPAAASLRIRLAQARLLITRSSASIATIAQATGFCDMAHFIRVFKKAERMTPLAYRRLSQDGVALDRKADLSVA